MFQKILFLAKKICFRISKSTYNLYSSYASPETFRQNL